MVENCIGFDIEIHFDKTLLTPNTSIDFSSSFLASEHISHVYYIGENTITISIFANAWDGVNEFSGDGVLCSIDFAIRKNTNGTIPIAYTTMKSYYTYTKQNLLHHVDVIRTQCVKPMIAIEHANETKTHQELPLEATAYPNPCSTELTIRVDKQAHIVYQSANNQLNYCHQTIIAENEQKIDVSQLQTGIYIFTVYTNQEQKLLYIIK